MVSLSQALPETRISIAGGVFSFHEHAMVLADHLLQCVSHGRQKVFIRAPYPTGRIELDDGIGRIKGSKAWVGAVEQMAHADSNPDRKRNQTSLGESRLSEIMRDRGLGIDSGS